MSELNDATKQNLRLAAVGALLHNLGKIHAMFLDRQVNNASSDYLYQHILGLVAAHVSKLPPDLQSHYDASKLTVSAVLDSATISALTTAFKLPTPLDDRTDYTVGDLIEYLGQGERWYEENNGNFGIEHIFPSGSRLTHLMNRAHRGASGGEKEDIATTQQPDVHDLYLSTPFGYETPAPNINNINDLLQKIEAVIQKYLTSLADPFPLASFIAEIRPLLSRAIADTQRPLNDVTVGDIGHSGMAFLITQAVEWILTKRSIDHAELAKKETDNTLFWRVLTIHIDSLRFLEEASSLADLRVRQQKLRETFREISQKLEETLLAVEIYADEQRRLFTFPDFAQDADVYRAVERVVTNYNVDGLRLICHLSDRVTNHPDDKNGTYIGDQVLEQLQGASPYDFDANTIATYWPKEAPSKQLCTACNLRPQGYGAEQVKAYSHNPAYYRGKAEVRNICCICMERRAGVAEKWAKEEFDKTVWLDEVADSNGRLALVVGQWELENFVRSHFYPHSRNSQSRTVWCHTVKFLNELPPARHNFTVNRQVYTWQDSHSVLIGEQELTPFRQPNLTMHAPAPMKVTVRDVVDDGEQLLLTVEQNLTSAFAVGSQVKVWGQDFQVVGIHLLRTINVTGRQKILSDVLWDATYPFIVQKTTKVNILEIVSSGEGAKNESFARLRRVWQTTQAFWQAALDEKDAEGKPILPEVDHRLKIIPHDRDNLNLGDYHTYDLKLTNGVKLSVVWDSDNRHFITCDNLAYLVKPELLGKPVIEFLQGELTLEEPTGYGGENKEWGKIIVEPASPIPNSRYVPTIPILAEPRTFMALVPADKALDIANAIHTKYAREMGKVRNRLPLYLGVVYFHRRTPLRAALDVGRRMLKYAGGKTHDALWTVQADANEHTLSKELEHLAAGTHHFDKTIVVTLQRDDQTLTWHVPAVMGDGATPDNWYPYVFIHGDVTGRQCVFKGVRPTNDGALQECWLIHAGELKKGDQVYFTPATLDFQWLDSAGQRFEIAYDEQGRRRNHPIRPYLLDELATIQQAWALIAGLNGLTSSQIYALRDLIETKRESWRPTANQCRPGGMFWQFCRDAIVTANWKKQPKADVDRLTGWAVSGLLADVIQLYMGIMKQKPQREENQDD
jgi:hypothetical protein